jgi:hypothetical protein
VAHPESITTGRAGLTLSPSCNVCDYGFRAWRVAPIRNDG